MTSTMSQIYSKGLYLVTNHVYMVMIYRNQSPIVPIVRMSIYNSETKGARDTKFAENIYVLFKQA